MANKRQNVSFCKSLESLILSRPIHLGEWNLDGSDQRRCANALSLWLLAFSDLTLGTDRERCYSFANLQLYAGRLAGCDIGVILSTLKSLLGQLRLWQPHMGRQSFRAYKAFMLQAFDGDPLTKEIMWPMVTAGYPAFDSVWFFKINTLVQFWFRLTLQKVDWILDENIRAYADLEVQMNEWRYPPDIVEPLRTIITGWLTGFTLWGGRPRHSDGATTECRRSEGKANKFHATQIDAAGKCLLAEMGYEDHPLVGIRDPDYEDLIYVGFVPKGIDKKRVVGPESTGHQWLQHGVADLLDEWFNRHPEMHIQLHNQERSQFLCLQASRKMSHSTRDLSSASDTVTIRLLEEIIPHDNPLWWAIMQTRTEMAVMPDGSRLRLAKAFPMGSSLCFPLESLVFASCCKLACDTVGCKPDFQVYGDDIIIPNEATYALDHILESLHFEVNLDKSYGPYSCFLEACGMEAYNGLDVSPCRLSRKYDIVAIRRGVSPTALTGAVKLANRLWEYGLYQTRRALVKEILTGYPWVPFSCNTAKGIYHPDPGNDHLWSRVNRDLQKLEYYYQRMETDSDPGSDDDRYQILMEVYDLTQRSALMDPPDRIDVSVGTTRPMPALVWGDLA